MYHCDIATQPTPPRTGTVFFKLIRIASNVSEDKLHHTCTCETLEYIDYIIDPRRVGILFEIYEMNLLRVS